MKRTALALALTALFTAEPALAAPAAAPAAASTEAVAAGSWDLRPLYATPAAWDTERQAILADLTQLGALKGTLGTSAEKLQAGLDQAAALRRRIYRLAVYASLAADADTRVTENQARNQLADATANKFGEATAWVTPEVTAIGADKIHAWLAATPGLAKHRYLLETTLRLAQHTLAPGEESLLAAAADPLQQPQSIYSLLTNADLPWPTLTIRGKKVTLDQEKYVAYRADPDPKVREQVFKAFWPVYKAFERTIGAVYAAELRGTVFQARARKYDSSLAMAQGGDNIPEAVYTTLVKEANAGLPTLHRYFKLRSRMLGLTEARYSDIYVPLAKPSRTNYTVAEAEALTLEALKPMGSEYEARLAAGFKGNWMDSNVQRGKRSGAYMNGAAYDVHPYLLMSFNGDYTSVSTLAHEWGHAMHTVYTDHTQPFETSDYSTFIAEIPSTANELLLADYMVAHAQGKAEKIFALSQELENLRGTFFRQAMFAEFELAAHQAAERGEPITGEMLTKLYLGLLKRYHGDAEGVVHIDDLYGIEWAYIPHFYTDFYVYQYATCVSAAAYFAEGIGKGDTALRERYFKLLEAGASAEPYQLVKAAGVDLASPEPYRAVVRRMNRVMDELEALTAQK
ncbi:MAG: oligoendopeptidase F [Pelomonas sp.]|nr:oligoendopeptidase F [Roseateles sp.]